MKRIQIVVLFAAAMTAMPALAVDWTTANAVVQAVIEVNPSLAALSAQIRAAEERVAPAGSQPNPMLTGGVQNQTVNLSYDFMTMYMVGASQTLVRKSKRDALRRSAELEVERLRSEYDARKAELERDVRIAYIDAASAQNEISATEEIARVLTSVSDSSRIRYETGAAPQTDLIRAILEESTVKHQILLLRRQRNTALTRLLALLNLAPNTPVPSFSLRHEMEHPHEQSIDAALPDVTPAIAGLQAEVARAEEDLHLAKLATKPDITIEASYDVRPRDTDMISVVGRIELPLRRSTLIEPRIREAIARREAALQQIETLRQQLRQDLGIAAVLRSEAIEQLTLHVDTLVPAAKLGFDSALVSYQNGKTTFDAVLGSLRTYVALNVDYYDFLRQQMEAEADIDAIRHGARSGASTPAPSGTSMQ